MPKCETDHALQDQVRRYMNENELTISGAAAKLKVERTKFWRFCNSGRAHDDTKASYRKALEKCNEHSAAFVANSEFKTDALAIQVRPASKGALADSELRLIRKACEGVLVLLDVYEAQSLGREN